MREMEMRHHSLIDLILRGILAVLVLAWVSWCSLARADIYQRPHGPTTRAAASDASPETRFALMERETQDSRTRLALLERNHHELGDEIRKELRLLDRRLTGIEAVAEANTQANWIVGGGFVAQFLFSLMRYLRPQIPKLKGQDA